MMAIAFLFVRMLGDWFKSRRQLEAEILALRHQLNVLQQRTPRRVHLNRGSRALFIWLYRRCPRILDAITVVRPETVVRWHRMGFAAYWRWKSRRPWGPAADRQGGTILSDALGGDFPFELGKRQEHVQGQPAHRGRRVELLSDRHKRHIVGVEHARAAGGGIESCTSPAQATLALAGRPRSEKVPRRQSSFAFVSDVHTTPLPEVQGVRRLWPVELSRLRLRTELHWAR